MSKIRHVICRITSNINIEYIRLKIPRSTCLSRFVLLSSKNILYKILHKVFGDIIIINNSGIVMNDTIMYIISNMIKIKFVLYGRIRHSGFAWSMIES